MSRFVSIIMPVLDHAAILGPSLAQVQALRAIGHEVIVSDGAAARPARKLLAPYAI